ncbi:hypothetical protein V6N13_090931 [Hibiscus sabdariffa]
MHGSFEGPRMGPGSLHLYLGFFLTTCGTSISGYDKYSHSLASPRCSACSYIAGVLFVTLCVARLWPPLEVFLHFTQPLVGCGTDYMGLAPLSCCPTSSDTGPLALSLPICLGVHRSLVDDVDVTVSTPLGTSGSSTGVLSTKEPSAPPASTIVTSSGVGNGLVIAPLSTGRPSSPVPVSHAPSAPMPAFDAHEHDPYDPMVHADTSDMLEDSLEIPTDCALLVDIDGIIQSHGEDLVHGAIDAAADALIREVAASVLGSAPLAISTDATVAPATTAAKPIASLAAMPIATPVASGLSRSALASARRLPLPTLPEHKEFDMWCAAQARPV